MRVGFDLDGTIDSDPESFRDLMLALRSAGHRIYVMTGAEDTVITPEKVREKIMRLQQLGCGDAYDVLAIFADPLAKKKAKFCRQNDIALLFDNNETNAKFASKYCTVLVPWKTRLP